MCIMNKLEIYLTKDELIDKLNFIDEEEHYHASRYLEFKGVMNHINIINFLIDDGVNIYDEEKKIKYSIVKSFYRYDKRLRKIAYKFIATFEEYIKAQMCLTDIDIISEWHKQRARWNHNKKQKQHEVKGKKLNKAEMLSEMSLGKLIEIMMKAKKKDCEKFSEYEKDGLNSILKLRNKTSHFSMITTSNKLNQSNELKQSMINLKNYLPEYYRNFFVNEIEKAFEIIKNITELKKYKISLETVIGERMIKIGIVGYGNLGKACEEISYNDKRFELVGIYTRRDPSSMNSSLGSKFYAQSDLKKFKDKIDVLLLCVGSANDLRSLASELGKDFCTVDSFDNHAEMRDHYTKMNIVATQNSKVALVGIGWDPGIFSIMRGLFDGVTPKDTVHTFWGKGVSQGHSEAIRKISGVKYAIQYTVPNEDIVEELKKGKRVDLDSKQKHIRECYVVCDKNDEKRIEDEIKSIPNYFVGYETKVNFITEKEFLNKHQEMPHGGLVIKNAEVCGKKEQMEFSLKLESNPKYTASVLMSYAIANYQFQKIHHYGAKTILDVPISFLLGEESISYV